MILTVQNTKRKEIKVMDMNGTVIPNVFYFNTKTGLIKMYISGTHHYLKKNKVLVAKGKKRNKIVKISVKIPGAFATVNGKLVK